MDVLTTFSEEERSLALKRFQLLRPHLEDGVALTKVAKEAELCFRTAHRWAALYRQFGLVGLTRKQRSDTGQCCLSSELQKCIEGLALQSPPLSGAAIHRRVTALAKERGENAPSYPLVTKIMRRLPDALTTLAQEGSKSYAQSYDLVHRREAEGPNVIWQADHCLMDIFLLREGKEPARPWLTTIIDDYSRAIAGYYLTFDAPSSLNTSLALRQAIWRKQDPRWHICGIPAIFYTDNGSDFTSQHLEQVSADLKIRLVFSIPGKPRGRGRIERFFDTLNQMFLSELPGYHPPKGSMRDKPQLTLTELDARLGTFLLDVYHQRPHSDTKTAPQQRWESGGFLPQMPTSLEQLDLLLLTVPTTRKVLSDGIRFQSLRYIDPTLAAYVGETVLLRYDPRDIAEIRVFYQNHFLCRAICQEVAGQTVSLREIIKARNNRRKELRKTIQDRQRTVDTLLELRRWDSKEEILSPAVVESEPKSPPLKRYHNE